MQPTLFRVKYMQYRINTKLNRYRFGLMILATGFMTLAIITSAYAYAAIGLLVLAIIVSAYAHTASLRCYIENNRVYIEAFFMCGQKVQNGRIYVFNQNGERILEAVTDKDGLCNFEPPCKDDFKIILRMNSGHRAELELTKQNFIDAEQDALKYLMFLL